MKKELITSPNLNLVCSHSYENVLEEALKIARQYGLDNEVKYCIEYCGMTLEEALREWDLL